MASVAGKTSSITVSTTTGGTYYALAGVKSFNHSIDGTNIDDSEMGVAWVQRIQGLKDGKLSIQGARRTDDTNGQNVLLSSFLNDTDLFVKMLPNGTVGYKQQMRVSKFAVDAAVEDRVNLSIELDGTGAITAV